MPTSSEWQGEPHTLTVHEIVRMPDGKCDDGEFEYDLEHLPSCKQERDGEGENSYTYYVCDIGWQEGEVGLASALCYSGSPITEPGTYRIAAWGSKTYYYWSGYEYDAGIVVLEPEEGETNAA